jgi:dTDP-4-amino-4,6-dideoxygalactose transaminase
MTSATEAIRVPLCDLAAQYDGIRSEIRAAIDEVLESQLFILGPQVAELERKIADYCGCKYGIGCSSGSDALLLALMSLGIGPGDEVVTTPYTFFATAGAIVRLGAKPIFVDIESEGYNIDPAGLERAFSPATKAIIPVHLFGQAAEMDPILELAAHYNVAVIEDAAQAIGARYKGRAAGSMGTIGCFSFFPSKNLGSMGDGGMVVTNDEVLAHKMRVLRSHGAEKKYRHSMVGGNFRLDTLQAAILLVKLRYLDGWNEARQKCANRYRELILASGAADICSPPFELPDRAHVYNQFVVRTEMRDMVREALVSRNIGAAIYYPIALHLQDCFAALGHRPGDFPKAELASQQTIALPIFAELTLEQQRLVVDAIESTNRCGTS